MPWFSKKEDELWIKEQVNVIYGEYELLKRRIPSAGELEAGFYDRYRKVMRSGLDLKSFVATELAHVQELNRQYEHRQLEAQEAVRRRQEAQEKLDAEIERLASSYLHYPKSPFVDARDFPELSHLYGAINDFEHRYWNTLSSRLRKDYAMTGNSPVTLLEEEIMMLTPPQKSTAPQALLSFSQSYRQQSLEMDREALEAMKQVSFFLNDLKDLLDHLNFDKEEEAYRLIAQIIQDFRLAAIKRRSL